MVMMVLAPSFQSFPSAEAIRSSHFLRLHSAGDYDRHFAVASSDSAGLGFRRAPFFHNAAECEPPSSNGTSVCNPSLVHIAITLDEEYLRGSIAVVHSVLTHARCSNSIFFHFLVSEPGLEPVMRSTFPGLRFKTYYFDPGARQGANLDVGAASSGAAAKLRTELSCGDTRAVREPGNLPRLRPGGGRRRRQYVPGSRSPQVQLHFFDLSCGGIASSLD
ncbi:hypothetical protein Cni_G23326 [Canna indica]|uniref:Uncharacterized protein n=1 Tax=Canna indica TaxID=4628 RepID=A0AAQ3KYB7_9LILI|nr:hypothetical protein Cni_G23326 [Canna indica]